MTNDDDFEIKILNEDPHPSPKPQPPSPKPQNPISQKVAEAARRAWESDQRKQLTKRAKAEADKVVAKGNQVVQEKVVEAARQQTRARLDATQEKLRQTDWKVVAQTGAAGGLHWLSRQVNRLANRFTPAEKEPPPADSAHEDTP
ncbi:MAG: hypothetical protein R6X32_04755 [Chloroflexota bacterium]|jgi:hypothetical protein